MSTPAEAAVAELARALETFKAACEHHHFPVPTGLYYAKERDWVVATSALWVGGLAPPDNLLGIEDALAHDGLKIVGFTVAMAPLQPPENDLEYLPAENERLRALLSDLIDSIEETFDTRRGELKHLRRLNAARAALEGKSDK